MTKKIAFLFPGQGSQSVGMLDSFKSNPSTASLFATAAQEAEQALGERFNIREFHDVVLGNGSLPLAVLEQQVRAYIAQQQADKTTK